MDYPKVDKACITLLAIRIQDNISRQDGGEWRGWLPGMRRVKRTSTPTHIHTSLLPHSVYNPRHDGTLLANCRLPRFCDGGLGAGFGRLGGPGVPGLQCHPGHTAALAVLCGGTDGADGDRGAVRGLSQPALCGPRRALVGADPAEPVGGLLRRHLRLAADRAHAEPEHDAAPG